MTLIGMKNRIIVGYNLLYYYYFAVLLGCTSKRLTFKQVAWLKVGTATILAFNDVVVTRNNRISVKKGPIESKGDEHIRTWKLIIRNVRVKDEGSYMCQLNTDETKAQTAYLEVTSK